MQHIPITSPQSVPQYISRRSPVFGTHGMVACSQPLAAQAGLRILQAGGNAAEAAVAIGAALCVTEPTGISVGGDAFALFYSSKDKRVHCMQGNGAAPAGLTLERVRAAGITGAELPHRHALTVAVPGAVALWEDAIIQWGNGKTLADVLNPAIQLAEQGFPVGPVVSYEWKNGAAVVKAAGGPGARALITEAGCGPDPGQIWVNKDLAATYRHIAQHGARKGFYTGPVAEAIVTAIQQRGGVMTLDDLAAHKTAHVEPTSTIYKGHHVWEVPPPAAGVIALMALNILEVHNKQQQQCSTPPKVNFGRPLATQWSSEQLHLLIESLRMAFADALAWVADPLVHEQPLEQMVCIERAQRRYEQYYNAQQACRPEPDHMQAPGPPKQHKGGDTCQWVVVDGEGNAASFIQSAYMGFGTGIVPEGCGFSLQNRCHGFNLQPGHPNSLAPGKRPYHTIIPGLVTDSEGQLVAAFGCMGAFMQPQGHVQLLYNLFERGLDPQAALDAPRFCIDKLDSAVGAASVLNSNILIEEGMDQDAVQSLAGKGHHVEHRSGFGRLVFGKGQIIVRDAASGVLCGGSDPRADGCVMAW